MTPEDEIKIRQYVENQHARAQSNKHLMVENAAYDPNNIANWLYLVAQTPFDIPRTMLAPVCMDTAEHIINGNFDHEIVKLFMDSVYAIIGRMMDITNQDKVFLRGSTTSNKHAWADSCYFVAGGDLRKHIYSIFEAEALSGRRSFYPNYLAIREFIYAPPLFYAFNKMPVTKEVRFFMDGGKVVHTQPYWPEKSIKNPVVNPDSEEPVEAPQWRNVLKKANDDCMVQTYLQDKVERWLSLYFRGHWSVDFLWADNTWWLIDMALGDDSYKWEYKSGK